MELRVNIKEWIEVRHKTTEGSALQIKWVLWAKIYRSDNKDHVSEMIWVQFRNTESVVRNKIEGYIKYECSNGLWFLFLVIQYLLNCSNHLLLPFGELPSVQKLLGLYANNRALCP